MHQTVKASREWFWQFGEVGSRLVPSGDIIGGFTAWEFKPCDQAVEGSGLLRGIARRLVMAWKP